MSKPSERIVKNEIDGKEVIDDLGRKLKLRKPNVLDMYDLLSALGEDSKNSACTSMASNILFVCAIDGEIVTAPKSYAEIRMALKRIGEEGISAINEFMRTLEVKSDKEQLEIAKK